MSTSTTPRGQSKLKATPPSSTTKKSPRKKEKNVQNFQSSVNSKQTEPQADELAENTVAVRESGININPRGYSSLSDRFRKELEDYLGDLDTKLDSEGNKLVLKPKNFDSIISAMSREDLMESTKVNRKQKSHSIGDGVDDKNFIKYLLDEATNQEFNKQFDGRYDNVMITGIDQSSENGTSAMNSSRVNTASSKISAQSSTVESAKEKAAYLQNKKIQKGLAEIYLLDRQLAQISKQAKTVNNPNGLSINTDANGDNNSEMNYSARSTPKSNDRTFLTKPRSEYFVIHKSNKNDDGTSTASANAKIEEEDTADNNNPYNLDDENLSIIENIRVDELLTLSDEEFTSKYLSNQTYYSDEYLANTKHIDDQLEQYDHMDRFEIDKEKDPILYEYSHDMVTSTIATGNTNKPPENYLAQQRKERLFKEHERKVEKMFSRLTTQSTVDYSYLVNSDKMNSNESACSRASYISDLSEIPLVEDIRLEVPITRADIDKLIEDLRKSYYNKHHINNQEETRIVNGNSNTTEFAKKEEIDQLLSKYKADLIRMELFKAEEQYRSNLNSTNQSIPSTARSTAGAADENDAHVGSAPLKRETLREKILKRKKQQHSQSQEDDEAQEADNTHTIITTSEYPEDLLQHVNKVVDKVFDSTDLNFLPNIFQTYNQGSIIGSIPPINSHTNSTSVSTSTKTVSSKKISSNDNHSAVKIVQVEDRVSLPKINLSKHSKQQRNQFTDNIETAHDIGGSNNYHFDYEAMLATSMDGSTKVQPSNALNHSTNNEQNDRSGKEENIHNLLSKVKTAWASTSSSSIKDMIGNEAQLDAAEEDRDNDLAADFEEEMTASLQSYRNLINKLSSNSQAQNLPDAQQEYNYEYQNSDHEYPRNIASRGSEMNDEDYQEYNNYIERLRAMRQNEEDDEGEGEDNNDANFNRVHQESENIGNLLKASKKIII